MMFNSAQVALRGTSFNPALKSFLMEERAAVGGSVNISPTESMQISVPRGAGERASWREKPGPSLDKWVGARGEEDWAVQEEHLGPAAKGPIEGRKDPNQCSRAKVVLQSGEEADTEAKEHFEFGDKCVFNDSRT